MPHRKRDALVSNDDDIVQYTQYRHTSQTQLPSKYDNISSYPQFDPLELIPIDNPGPNLPQDIDLSDPETLF
jgi:hypothetical protein